MQHLSLLRQLPNLNSIAVPIRFQRVGQLLEEGQATVHDKQEAIRMGATLGIIATDTGRHVQDALWAVENGLDVLVEKPLSHDASSAHRLCVRAAELRRRVFVGCRLRFSTSLNTFRDVLGRIGRLHAVRIESQSYLPDWRPRRAYRESYSARADEGGVLRDLIHEIDYAGWLFGWPATLQARVQNLSRLGIEADEAAHLMWETPEGCVVSVGLDYLSRPPRRRMRASGEWGTLEWDAIEGSVTLNLAAGFTEVISAPQTLDAMLYAQDCAFIEASYGVCDTRLVPGSDGVKALAVCDAARRASDSRREEKVEYL